jgi:hypothetical protein
MVRASVGFRGGGHAPAAVEIYGQYWATARVMPGNGAEVTVGHRWRFKQQTFGAYLLWGRWRCHGLARSDLPSRAKQLGACAVRRLPTRRGDVGTL